MPPAVASTVRELRHLSRILGLTLLYVYVPLITVLVLWHYPYDTDAPEGVQVARKSSASFYEVAYAKTAAKAKGIDYEAVSEVEAEGANIKGKVGQFASQYNLASKRVLEIGSGRGYLQDVVADYTGLDISPTVAPKYHKPFVVGSATKLPFGDDSFDAAWTVWVVEHIAQPEKVFSEMRRVIKPGGVLYLNVAWECKPWFADGFDVRPYEDFNLAGKLVKASIPLRQTNVFVHGYRVPVRLLRWANYAFSGNQTKLQFRALTPNYDTYWEPDGDAAVSLDSYEAMLWFQSRGDNCLNCDGNARELVNEPTALHIRINKPSAVAAQTR